ncbi:MAG: FAD-dependent oxidoreductase [Planctomycetota bacterium]
MIGAGLSGLACAAALDGRRCAVTVFEKSRGVGGRMATRRTEHGARFDHGAQYFTVRDERFAAFVQRCEAAGAASRWRGRIASLGQALPAGKAEQPRHVGTPGMNALCGELAGGLDVRLETRCAPPVWVEGERRWRLASDQGQPLGEYEAVVVSAPAPQAAQLLAATPALASAARAVQMRGCWAVMAAFAERLPLDFDGAFVHGSPLSWVARNSSKPGRDTTPGADAWVLHASPEWSDAHIEREPAAAAGQLLAAFGEATGVELPKPEYASAHRWRYALPAEPLPDRCLYDAAKRIGACGDWCGGPRVEGAYLSGLALADKIAASKPIASSQHPTANCQ